MEEQMEVPLYGLAVGVAEDVSKGEGVKKEGHEIKICSLIVSIHLVKLQQRRKHKRESKYPIVYIYIPQDIDLVDVYLEDNPYAMYNIVTLISWRAVLGLYTNTAS